MTALFQASKSLCTDVSWDRIAVLVVVVLTGIQEPRIDSLTNIFKSTGSPYPLFHVVLPTRVHGVALVQLVRRDLNGKDP